LVRDLVDERACTCESVDLVLEQSRAVADEIEEHVVHGAPALARERLHAQAIAASMSRNWNSATVR
jgi:hypothetical protein